MHKTVQKQIAKFEKHYGVPYTRFIEDWKGQPEAGSYWHRIIIENKRLTPFFLNYFKQYFTTRSKTGIKNTVWHVLMEYNQVLNKQFILDNIKFYNLKNDWGTPVWQYVVRKQFENLNKKTQKQLFKTYYKEWDIATINYYLNKIWMGNSCKFLLNTTISPDILKNSIGRFGRIHVDNTLIGHNNVIANYTNDNYGLFSNVPNADGVIEKLLGEL